MSPNLLCRKCANILAPNEIVEMDDDGMVRRSGCCGERVLYVREVEGVILVK